MLMWRFSLTRMTLINNGVDLTTVADHEHPGDSQGVSSVPLHAHAAVDSSYDSDTWEKGPDHAHPGNNGGVSYVEPHVHSYTAPDSSKPGILQHQAIPVLPIYMQLAKRQRGARNRA